MNKRIIIITLLLVAAFSAQAQKKWSLEECISYAVEHNITIKQLEIQKESAEISLNTSQMSRLPNLNAGGGQNWSFGRTNSTETGVYENRTTSNTSYNISSSLPIFTGFRIPNEIAKGKLDLKAAVENMEKAKENLALSVASLYLQVLFNKELLKVAEEQLQLTQHQLAKTQSLIEVGKAPKAQLYDVESQAASDEVSIVNARNSLTLSLLELAQSLELMDVAGFDIEEPQFDNAVSDLMASLQIPDAIYANALNVKPVIREQEYRLESSEKSLNIAKAGYLPMVNMSMGHGSSYFYNYDKDVNNIAFSKQMRDNAGQNISLSLSVPIFNRFATRNQVRNARLNIENQRLTLENTKKTLYKEIQTAYTSATASQEKFVASQKAVKASQESLSNMEQRYELGKSNPYELNESRLRYIQSRSEEVQAKYDFIFKAKILDFYNGIPIRL